MNTATSFVSGATSRLFCISTVRTMDIMAKPNPKGPTKTVNIYCNKCKTQLFKYRKGGKGALVKCFKERIVHDMTNEPCTCPSCGTIFARDTLIRGTPAFKIIGGKAFAR